MKVKIEALQIGSLCFIIRHFNVSEKCLMPKSSKTDIASGDPADCARLFFCTCCVRSDFGYTD